MAGSTWNKWNLHIHTKGTNKNDNFTPPTMESFWQFFFKKALAAKVSAIAITDYFTIENYLKAKEYVDNLTASDSATSGFNDSEVTMIKQIFLLPNVELRMLPATGSSRLLNIHCIFNPDYVPHLNNDFFGEMENEAKFKMNRDGITNYGRKTDSSLDDHVAYKNGLDKFTIDPRSLKTVLDQNENFRNNTLVIVSNSNRDGNSGFQEHYSLFENEPGSLDGVRQTVYYISDAIFSANPKDIAYFLGKRLDDKPNVTDQERRNEKIRLLQEQGALKACLVGCDAHTEADLFKRFTWIKGTLNFQGLRQIMYEPEQRVKIQDEEPDQKDEKHVIDHVKFTSANNVFTPAPLSLNSNLNVIIGGKSSGKSILLYHIAKTLLPDRAILKSEIEPHNFKYDFGNNFNFEVTISSGQTQSSNRSDETPSILPEIKYIPQNHLSYLAEPDNKKGNELIKLIRSLLVEDDLSRTRYEEFISRLKSNDLKMELLINSYFEIRERITSQKTALIQQGNEDVLKANISSNEQKIQKLKEGAGLSDEQIEEYNKLNSQLQIADTDLNKLRSDYSKLTTFNTDARTVLQDLVLKKTLTAQSLEIKLVRDFFDEQYMAITDALDKIQLIITLIAVDGDRKFINDNVFKTLSSQNNSLKNTLIDALQPFLKNLANKKEIEDLEKLIAGDQQKLSYIQQMKIEIANNEKAFKEEKSKILHAYKENFNEYTALVSSFGVRTKALENDRLHILGSPRFNFPKFRSSIATKMDGRKANFSEYPLLEITKTGTTDFSIESLILELERMFNQMTEGSFPFTTRADLKTSVKELFSDYFFDYWDVEYDNDALTKMSSGKASFVILMLIVGLSKSKAPILIDQPEDNLDNRSITKDLVEYLKNKKLERQIILVTHNANVVVNADAENIIVANQKGQTDNDTSSPFRFDYTNGPLEFSRPYDKNETDLLQSMGIREHVTDIVEGGEDAFRRRERKYGFTKR